MNNALVFCLAVGLSAIALAILFVFFIGLVIA